MKLLKGFRAVLEDFIIMVVWSHALVMMNLNSCIDIGLVVLFYLKRRSGTMRTIMNTVSIVMLARLCITLSNMNEALEPNQYPWEYRAEQWNKYGEWQFWIPWIEYFPKF